VLLQSQAPVGPPISMTKLPETLLNGNCCGVSPQASSACSASAPHRPRHCDASPLAA